ncbi:HD-GYP domain-containing protein [Paenibacillus sp. LHD-38]|uniref:HD-GYP domain-containing protein n=1 Tax=Paenibacillus sp. LHD-38 TaxID=3072143 RepID=UPI00280FB480|nr:HD-GYP domain-containing protein [Paenibacillus sp. LHD-38]MDQ8735980.1 HD-GYP domain-containing protein [Paenibacillus sp. LHD-38]
MEQLIGKKIKHDILNAYGVTIVPADSVLTPESLQIIINHRIDMNSLVFASDKKPVQENSIQIGELVQQTVTVSKELFESILVSRKVPLMEIRNEVLPAILQLSKNPDIFELFEAVKAKDDYVYQHNIGVGVISTLIGRWLNLDDSELSILSLAATLHDVGKVKLPLEVLNKPGKLNEAEFQLVKKHTIFGYEMLKGTTGLSLRIARVALQHHEREDGNGYPLGLKKENIDLFSSIVSVADIFHAMSSKRPYHEPLSFHEIVEQMSEGKFGALNPQIISVFIENMMKRLVGRQVLLTDGRAGEVVYINPHNIETPLIKLADYFLDLSQERDVHIQSIIA